MSAIVEEPDGVSFDPIKVLIAVQDGFDLCDMAGPMEVFGVSILSTMAVKR